MQYNHYHSTSQRVHPVSPLAQSPDDYAPPYPDSSHQHAALSYAAVTPASPLAAGSIAHHSITPQYPYPHYTTQSAADDHRSYYAPSQGPAIDHYPAPSSPTTSYTSPTPSSHINSQPARHHAHLPQQQQQFIPTPSQAYQVFSAGPTSPPRSRSTAEPYYHMSPNPQHVLHAPPASMGHGAGGCPHTNYAHPSAHTCATIVATGERYPCDRCDRSFTRLHDRRRHYETVHSTSPVLHKCRFCRKDFSRSDSLKRHVDNGCDEMPR